MATTYIPKIVYDGNTITFDFPVKGPDPFAENLKANSSISQSKSGLQQTLLNFTEIENSLVFSHVSQSIKDSVNTLLTTWAFLGNEFDYFPDKDDAGTKITVTLARSGMAVKYKVLTWTGIANANAIYEFRLRLRRVV